MVRSDLALGIRDARGHHRGLDPLDRRLDLCGGAVETLAQLARFVVAHGEAAGELNPLRESAEPALEIERDAPVSLIGDAPQDIIAARENGIRSISVQTGITPVEDLVAEKPDFLLTDLRGLRLRMVE